MEDIADTLVIMIERLLNKKDIELTIEDIDTLRNILDEILEKYDEEA